MRSRRRRAEIVFVRVELLDPPRHFLYKLAWTTTQIAIFSRLRASFGYATVAGRRRRKSHAITQGSRQVAPKSLRSPRDREEIA